MPRSFLRASLLVLPLFLTACGDGWEAQKTSNFQPYGNKRTAGSGVVYVRAQLLPEKDLKLEPELPKAEPVKETPAVPVDPVEEAEPSLDAEKIFNDAQIKGQSAQVESSDATVDKHVEAAVEHVEKHATAEGTAPLLDKVTPEDHKAAEGEDDREHAVLGTPVHDSKVELETKPEHARKKEAMGFESGLMHSELSPEAGDVLDEIVEVEEDFAERALRQPIKEIVVPKRDSASILSVGQETLNEIYDSPF